MKALLLSLLACGSALLAHAQVGDGTSVNVLPLGPVKNCPCTIVSPDTPNVVVIAFRTDSLCRISGDRVIASQGPVTDNYALSALDDVFKRRLLELNHGKCRPANMTIGIRPDGPMDW